MFKKKTKRDVTTTQDLIDAVNARLLGMDEESEEYKKTFDYKERLHKLQDTEKKSGFKVSGDTLVIAGMNFLGILVILNYEKLGIVTSKALGFVGKSKL